MCSEPPQHVRVDTRALRANTIPMDPTKHTRPSHDQYDVDRDGPSSGVNQVNPNDTPATRGTDKPGHQGGDPSEVKPRVMQPSRDSQPDGKRDAGIDVDAPDDTARRGGKSEMDRKRGG